MTNARITITFDVTDSAITWNEFADILSRNMPTTGTLKVSEGLSATIARQYIYGNFRMDVTGTTNAR